jgi:hypothetical protein
VDENQSDLLFTKMIKNKAPCHHDRALRRSVTARQSPRGQVL